MRPQVFLLVFGLLILGTSTAHGHGIIPTQGADDAPIVIVQYGDFQCVSCAFFNREVMPRLQEAYIDTGTIRFSFHHFPWIGPTSRQVAHAATCAHAQGAFWEYHDYLYGHGRSARTERDLIALAQRLDLDTDVFGQCLQDGKTSQFVSEQYARAREEGVVATPTFFVNDQLLVGLISFDQWVDLINELLGETDRP